MSATVRFSREEVDLFCAASHDQNPLHRSAAYARKTVYGEPVIFGVLGALALLGKLRERPGQRLASLSVDFRDALSIGIGYEVEIDEAGDVATAVLQDGRRTLIFLEARFEAGAAPSFHPDMGVPSPRMEAAELSPADLQPGLTVRGRYAPFDSAFSALLQRYALPVRGISASDAAALCLASFVVGMEVPGKRALFSRLSWAPHLVDGGAIDYEARVSAYDERFDLVRLAVTLASRGHSLGTLNLEAFVRTDVPAPAAPPSSDVWAGKLAVITGASRGLGAAMARSLAWQGCTVMALFFKSRAEAEALATESAASSGRIIPVEADAGHLGACDDLRQRLVGEGRPIDLLVCNAFPPVRSLWLDAASAPRIESYMTESIRLVCSPLSIFLPMLAESAGQAALISSTWVSTLPAEWPHYVSAKLAAEGLIRVAAKEYPRVRFLVARPPRLLTDLTNTPTGRRATVPVDVAATAIVARLAASSAPGVVDVWEDPLVT